jgi:hypothetical protein
MRAYVVTTGAVFRSSASSFSIDVAISNEAGRQVHDAPNWLEGLPPAELQR